MNGIALEKGIYKPGPSGNFQKNRRFSFNSFFKKKNKLQSSVAQCIYRQTTMAANRLADKNILLIGGTSGIGFAVAKQSLDDGANITISSSSGERVTKAVDRLRTHNSARASAVRSYVADLDLSIRDTLEKSVEDLLKFASEEPPIDHIVFTAGNVPTLVPLAEASFDDVEAFLTVRFFGAMAVGKYALKYVAASKSSSITLTTGTQSKKPSFWLPPAVTGMVEGLMKGLASTLSPVRVNAVSPGFVLTELIDRLPKEVQAGAVEKYTHESLKGYWTPGGCGGGVFVPYERLFCDGLNCC